MFLWIWEETLQDNEQMNRYVSSLKANQFCILCLPNTGFKLSEWDKRDSLSRSVRNSVWTYKIHKDHRTSNQNLFIKILPIFYISTICQTKMSLKQCLHTRQSGSVVEEHRTCYIENSVQVWWLMPVTLLLQKARWENRQKFETSLG